ncbi:MAG: Holliday junction branch migration protein RuvA [Deltaproteobacteria bacterium]|nr:Holliday junction branch migration protein RuvA [Deltaproteobacteria bacterium]
MIAWLKGTIHHIKDCEIVLNVGDVGYLVQVGQNQSMSRGYQAGQEIELAIYTQLKQDEMRLFGFESFDERELFLRLISVNGVGPKMAINIIDQLTPPRIVGAIRENSSDTFQSVSGVGKKTAQRIILDLKDKLKDAVFMTYGTRGGSDLDAVAGTGAGGDLIEDAASALRNLGFQTAQIQISIQKHFRQGIKLDDLIKKCLSELSQISSKR